MYHVPYDDTWDAKAIAESLRRRGVVVEIVGDTVRVPLSPRKPRSIVAKLIRRLFPRQHLYITISYCPERFIRNVKLAYDPMEVPQDLSCFDAITEAMLERRYWTNDDRTIAARYAPESPQLMELFVALEQLQSQKLN